MHEKAKGGEEEGKGKGKHVLDPRIQLLLQNIAFVEEQHEVDVGE